MHQVYQITMQTKLKANGSFFFNMSLKWDGENSAYILLTLLKSHSIIKTVYFQFILGFLHCQTILKKEIPLTKKYLATIMFQHAHISVIL